ncbi:formimidoylglutamate deiminase, partial [Streptomyces minutiscleroticus]
MTTYWLEHAWLGTHVEPGVTAEVRDGRLAAVRDGVAAPPPDDLGVRG